jgi:hypothetical protein
LGKIAQGYLYFYMSNFSLEEKQKEQFNFSHLGLIALCAVFLLSVSIMKNGFSLNFSNTKKESKKVSYTEVLAEVQAKNNSERTSQVASSDSNEKLALVDPNLQTGQVAGASVGSDGQLLDLTQANESLTAENLEQLKIKINSESGAEAVKKYSENLLNLETEYGAMESISNLASQDKTVLKNTSDSLALLSAGLLNLEVPNEVATFHRLKITYYGTALAMTNYYLGAKDFENLDSLTEVFFASTEQMEKIKQEIYTKYQVSL